METQLVLFLALTSITLFTNVVLICVVYKVLSRLTSKVTGGVAAFNANDSMKTWVYSMQSASEQAVNLTQTAKERMADSEQGLGRAQDEYALSLARADAKLEGLASGVCMNAEIVRDAIAKPAFTIMAFISGLIRMLRPEETEDEQLTNNL